MRDNPVVPCPNCRRRGDWFATPFGPFCSERCRLIDLGKWFNEEQRVSEPLRPDHFEGYESLPPDVDPDDPRA